MVSAFHPFSRPPDGLTIAQPAGFVAVPATANINTYASLPTPAFVNISFERVWTCQLIFGAHIDIETNNAESCLALDFSGDVTIPAGSITENRIHIVCKSPISVSLNVPRTVAIPPGNIRIELMHSGSAFNLEDAIFSITPMFTG